MSARSATVPNGKLATSPRNKRCGAAACALEGSITLQRRDAGPLAAARHAWAQAKHGVARGRGRVARLRKHLGAAQHLGFVLLPCSVATLLDGPHGVDHIGEKDGARPQARRYGEAQGGQGRR